MITCIDQKFMSFSPKLPCSKKTYRKNVLTIFFNMPKLHYAEFFSGCELSVRSLQQQQKCNNSLKIVKAHKSQSFVNIFFKMYKIFRLGTMQLNNFFLVDRACTK